MRPNAARQTVARYRATVRRLFYVLHAQLALRVAAAQDLLVELSDAGLGHLVDEGPALGKPPARALAVEVRAQRRDVERLSRTRDHARQRPLAPFLVGHADDGGFGDGGVRHQ